VPMQLRNAPTRLMNELGYGAGYVYAHDTDEKVGHMECLPPELAGLELFRPGQEGWEKRIVERLREIAERRRRAAGKE